MSRGMMPFGNIRQRVCERILEYLRSRSTGSATIQELRWFCRTASMGGMAEAGIDWLEQAGAIRYERDLGAVYLTTPGATRALERIEGAVGLAPEPEPLPPVPGGTDE